MRNNCLRQCVLSAILIYHGTYFGASRRASTNLGTGRHAQMQAQSKHRLRHLRPSINGM